jgi:DNA-binding response OmpR family regulator
MTERVLIVEDDDNIRQLIAITLRKPGREIVESPDGETAVNLARSLLPDLVILDVMMPGMNGYQVCEKLRSDPATASLRVVFLTSRSGVPAESAMKKAGADFILQKPFVPSELRVRIDDILLLPAPSASPDRSRAPT